MADLDLTSLRLFVLVCDSGSIARAASHTTLMSSAISKRLSQLQADFGVALLQRHRQGLVPTAAGQALLERARGMLQEALAIELDMSAYLAGARGSVRMLASASAMAEALTDDIASFLQQPQFANIRIDLEERVSAEIVRGVQEGVASLGVCWDAAQIGNLQFRPYRSDELAVVVRENHPLARLPSLSFAQTLDFEHVSMPVNSAVQVMLMRAAASLGRTMLNRVVVSNFESALRVVRAGLAICIVPKEVAVVYQAQYRLATLTLDEPWAIRRFIICYRDPNALSPAAQLLLEALASTSKEKL